MRQMVNSVTGHKVAGSNLCLGQLATEKISVNPEVKGYIFRIRKG